MLHICSEGGVFDLEQVDDHAAVLSDVLQRPGSAVPAAQTHTRARKHKHTYTHTLFPPFLQPAAKAPAKKGGCSLL